MKRSFRPNVNLDAEGVLEILNQCDLVEQAASRFPINQEIDIAFFVGLAARHGTEHPHVVGSVPRSQAQDFLTPGFPQRLQGDHAFIVRQIRAAFHETATHRSGANSSVATQPRGSCSPPQIVCTL